VREVLADVEAEARWQQNWQGPWWPGDFAAWRRKLVRELCAIEHERGRLEAAGIEPDGPTTDAEWCRDPLRRLLALPVWRLWLGWRLVAAGLRWWPRRYAGQALRAGERLLELSGSNGPLFGLTLAPEVYFRVGEDGVVRRVPEP